MAEQYSRVDNLGDKYYYKDPIYYILHREDGPAVERADGDELWYQNGELHRLDGPAIISVFNGHREWYVDGVFIFMTDYKSNILYRIR